MQFHIGAIPEARDFLPDGTWRPLREPTPWVMQVLALPLGIIGSLVVGTLWFFLTPLRGVSLDTVSMEFIAFACLATITIHELIHAAVHPRSGTSSSSILGIWPSRCLFYAHYDGELSRGRFVAILLMPLLIISFVPLLVCAFTGRSSSLLAFVSTLNALCACGDIFAAGLLFFQVPPNATVRNQGWRTFWKVYDTNAA
jgi:hypothetical protein